MSDIVDISVALPPVEEQERILLYLNSELSDVDNLANKAQAFIDLLREHRTALIAAAVTGQIDVRGWAGSDGSDALLRASTDVAQAD